MHNLAIALHLKGYHVTGSDDEIFDPAKSRLQRYGLLPASYGWHPERITPDLDAIVLGMHARKDNPELLRAQELGIKIYSYPEYLYEQSKDKTRVVIGGSHGKTTTTAMILHVLQHCGVEADYMVGAQLEGFEVMVRLSETAKVMVLEGDEYLTSPIDLRPKFHQYRPHVAIITGIEWDHINVVVNGVTCLLPEASVPVPLKIFGRHNLLNLTAARYACNALGISDEQFDDAIQSFGGASKRLELVKKTDDCAVYKDFAHAPSKLRATISAMREQYPNRRLVACMELHTFSSLTAEFLKQYAGTMDNADVPFVYYSQHALQLKKLPNLDPEQVKASFANDKVRVFTDSKQMVDAVIQTFKQSGNQAMNLLMMSSGNFDGIDFKQLADELID